MRILVIGKNGMLGNAILETSTHWDHEVVGWGREELDITDHQSVIDKISKLNPEVIINTAALTNVDLCEDEPETANTINGKAAGYIAEAAAKIDAKLIHISTDYVFDGRDQSGYEENHPVGPINKYGESKLLGEQLVAEKCHKHFIARVSWLFGVNPLAIPKRLDFIRQLLSWSEKNNELTILNTQLGKVTYSYDVAAAIEKLITTEDYGIYHFANEGENTRFQFAKKVFEILSKDGIAIKPGTLEDLNITLKAERPDFSSLINTKTSPLRHWEEALTDYLNRFYV